MNAKTPAQPTLNPVQLDRNSPILLMGDSHTLVFHEGGDMHARGAGLPDQLAREFGTPIDLIGVRGSGATPARTTLMRRVRANPNYLKNKKLIIWCFSAREFTESSGWQKVPIVP
jgi:alginate O-acetyltransferase complex protein AlgJ